MPPQRRATPLPWWMVVVAAVIPLAVLAIALVSAGEEGEGEPPAGFDVYAAAIRSAFAPAVEPLLEMARTAARWVEGGATDDELAAALAGAERALPDLRADVAAVEEPEGAATAHRFHLATVDLYAQAVAAHRAALAADGAVQVEINLLARRVRTLADRVYDRARAIVEPAVADPEGVRVERSDPVPSWEEEGLAPGELLGGAGSSFEAQAQASPVDEPARRRSLQLLVLAEAERARVLGLEDLAVSLEQVAGDLADGA